MWQRNKKERDRVREIEREREREREREVIILQTQGKTLRFDGTCPPMAHEHIHVQTSNKKERFKVRCGNVQRNKSTFFLRKKYDFY